MTDDFRIGQLVRSKKGRDKGGLFIVTGTTEKHVCIADGGLRKISRAEKKNPRHLQPVNIFADGDVTDDRYVARFIKEYEKTAEKKQEGNECQKQT